jgi:hypothetical protein
MKQSSTSGNIMDHEHMKLLRETADKGSDSPQQSMKIAGNSTLKWQYFTSPSG